MEQNRRESKQSYFPDVEISLRDNRMYDERRKKINKLKHQL